MKSFKKLLVLSFSTMLAFGLFACDGKDNSNSNSVTSEATSGDSTSSSVEEVEKLGDLFADVLKQTYGTEEYLNKTAEFKLPTKPTMFNSKDEEVAAEITYTIEIVDGVENVITLGEVDSDNFQHFTVKYSAEDSVVESHVKVTANIKVSDEDTATYVFNYVVPVFKYATFNEFKDAADNSSTEVLNVKGTVVAIYKSGLYIVDEAAGGFYAYNPDSFSAGDYKVGEVVLVAGTPTKYMGQYEFNKGCTVTKISDAPAEFKPTYTDITSVFDSATNASDAAFIPYQNSLVTVSGVTVGSIDEANFYYYFTKNDIKYYARTSTSHNGLTENACKEMMKEWTEGYTATVSGLLSIYNGNYYITPLFSDAVVITDKTLSDEAKTSADVNTVLSSLKAVYASNTTITLPTEGANKSVLSYEITAGDNTKLDGNVFNVVLAAEDTNYTIKVTATLNGKTSDSEFQFVVKAIPDTTNGVNMTADYLGLGKYGDGSATIGDYTFDYTELGSYGDGIQMRKTSSIGNTNAFAKPIESIEFNYSANKSTYDNADVFKISFGTDATVASYSANLSTVKDVKTYTITPDSATYTYFKMEKVVADYSYYWDSIVIKFVDDTPKPTIITNESSEIALGDITVILDGNNMIKFASFTAPGYGGPADGFYHDGTYAWKAGEVCLIWDLDANFNSWAVATNWGSQAAEKVEYNGAMVNPWGAYSLVPAADLGDLKIVTGSVDVMLPIVNSLWNKEFTEMTRNGFFENDLKDGDYNNKVVDMENWTLVDPAPVTSEVVLNNTAIFNDLFGTAPGYAGYNGDHDVNGLVVTTTDVMANNSNNRPSLQMKKGTGTITIKDVTFTSIEFVTYSSYDVTVDNFSLKVGGETITLTLAEEDTGEVTSKGFAIKKYTLSATLEAAQTATVEIKNVSTNAQYLDSITIR